MCYFYYYRYPFDPAIGQRHGDPIADQYGIIQYADRSCIIAVADGCNWGERPCEAAVRARDGFLAYLHRKRAKLVNSVQAVHYMLRGFNRAHEAIFRDKDQPGDAGSTTLIGAVVLPVASNSPNPATEPLPSKSKVSDQSPSTSSGASGGGEGGDTPAWQLITASVGDCRGYLLSDGAFKPIGEHLYEPTGRDPGGRLGSWVSDHPDLRNLAIHSCPVQSGDMLLFWTDGVTDNLDARHLGKLPLDIPGLEEYPNDWAEVPSAATPVVERNLQSTVRAIIGDRTDPAGIVTSLVQHCLDTTRSSRTWMLENPGRRLPRDYKLFPGKMDHTTCLCVQIVPHIDTHLSL